MQLVPSSEWVHRLRGGMIMKWKFTTAEDVSTANVPVNTAGVEIIPKVITGSSKRSAEEELGEESSKRQKIGEGSKPAEESKDKESDELSQEQLQQLIIIVPEEG
ncbi:hypothetical protein Tco_0403864 [Tanacetum coccineum]